MRLAFFKKYFFLFFLIFIRSLRAEEDFFWIKRINIPNLETVFNPSIIDFQDGYLLSFRFLPDPVHAPLVSLMGLVTLNKQFEITSAPEFLNTNANFNDTKTPHAEDARLIKIGRKIFIIFNDLKNENPSDKREIYLGQIKQNNQNKFFLESLVKLTNQKNSSPKCEKNWFPFEYQSELYLGYSVDPFEIIKPNYIHGLCKNISIDHFDSSFWNFGKMRGGTNAIKIDNFYLSFFHSSIITKSESSMDKSRPHYFMGAFTYDAFPPFEIRAISTKPLLHDSFYTSSEEPKRVIFPCGALRVGDDILISYGKDDKEIWLAKIKLDYLMDTLIIPSKQPSF